MQFMNSIRRRFGWIGFVLMVAAGATSVSRLFDSDNPSVAHAATQPQPAIASQIGSSGLPVPRFASLKNRRVNVRKGPSQAHSIAWQFQRAGLPVEITRESENWRMIRDSEGEEGWVFHSLLSGERTAVVAPWDRDAVLRVLREGAGQGSGALARIEPQVVVAVEQCDGSWCEVDASGHKGWIEQVDLWGVYAGEVIGR